MNYKQNNVEAFILLARSNILDKESSKVSSHDFKLVMLLYFFKDHFHVGINAKQVVHSCKLYASVLAVKNLAELTRKLQRIKHGRILSALYGLNIAQ